MSADDYFFGGEQPLANILFMITTTIFLYHNIFCDRHAFGAAGGWSGPRQ
jgi:hypothetical protein